MYKRHIKHYVSKKKRQRIRTQEEKRYIKYIIIGVKNNTKKMTIAKPNLMNTSLNKNERVYSTKLRLNSISRILTSNDLSFRHMSKI